MFSIQYNQQRFTVPAKDNSFNVRVLPIPQLDTADGCPDYVTFQDGGSSDSPLLDTKCFDNDGSPVTGTDFKMRITFTSDASGQGSFVITLNANPGP